MLPASSRLLRLLSLLTARRLWEGPQLAAELEVTERTLRRDIDKLRTLGYPVRSQAGVAGGYQLGAGARLPPLLLDADEAMAVALGLRTTATGAIVGAETAAARALTKLQQVLPTRIQRKVKALHAAIATPPWAGPSVDADVLLALASACHDRACLQVRYVDAQGTPTNRQVQPHGMSSLRNRWYLAAWDELREDFRTFRVDRIESVRSNGSIFQRRPLPTGSVESYLARSVAERAMVGAARLVVDCSAAEATRHYCGPGVEVEELDGARCTITGGQRAILWTCIALSVGDVAIHSVQPPQVADQVDRLAAKLARIGRSPT